MQTLPLRFQNWMVRQPRSRAGEPPLRAELFGVEQLARHAKALAANHKVVTRQRSNHLLARLGQNEDILSLHFHDTRHHFISECVMSGVDFMTIAKWVGHSSCNLICNLSCCC
jgi:integrase